MVSFDSLLRGEISSLKSPEGWFCCLEVIFTCRPLGECLGRALSVLAVLKPILHELVAMELSFRVRLFISFNVRIGANTYGTQISVCSFMVSIVLVLASPFPIDFGPDF